ncbi:MAG: tRNA 2-thiouridine(34) synthase MnmA [Deltaproteobacteria bacterium]|nr:tRNA 2-thiouridine(34) synthase MnmA [Deltaproteobacteria bacterium]
MNNGKVAVGLSGGVDSAVAAYLLKEQGYDLVGVTMVIWDDKYQLTTGNKHGCFGPEEYEDVDKARKVCLSLNIEHKIVSLVDDYKKQVLNYFRQEYLSGRTPNPCIRCNTKIKFGLLVDKVKQSDFNFRFFATGHYAQIEHSQNSFFLKKAKDNSKDQSYFLSGLTRDQLAFSMFPLGGLTKKEVRSIAINANLPVAEEPESQDFIGGADYSELFKEQSIPVGDTVDSNGIVLGKHKGLVYYTVGQRRNLGISSAYPLYVLELDAKNNRVIVGKKEETFKSGLTASALNILLPEGILAGSRLQAKIRQKHTPCGAIVNQFDGNSLTMTFDDPQSAITPGQTVVFYNNDYVIGSGVIDRAL